MSKSNSISIGFSGIIYVLAATVVALALSGWFLRATCLMRRIVGNFLLRIRSSLAILQLCAIEKEFASR